MNEIYAIYIFKGLAYACVINLVAYASFYIDKKLAQNQARRISEANLLAMAALGGTIGAITAQQKFRHKTRKQPFKSQLYTIAVLQIIFCIALLFPSFRQGALEFIQNL